MRNARPRDRPRVVGDEAQKASPHQGSCVAHEVRVKPPSILRLKVGDMLMDEAGAFGTVIDFRRASVTVKFDDREADMTDADLERCVLVEGGR